MSADSDYNDKKKVQFDAMVSTCDVDPGGLAMAAMLGVEGIHSVVYTVLRRYVPIRSPRSYFDGPPEERDSAKFVLESMKTMVAEMEKGS